MVLIGLNVEEECWLEIKSVLFKFLKGHTLLPPLPWGEDKGEEGCNRCPPSPQPSRVAGEGNAFRRFGPIGVRPFHKGS
jgi:hypothetical protein